MIKTIDKKPLNFIVIIVLTFFTFWWTFYIFNESFDYNVVLVVLSARVLSSLLIFKDYSLSWSKATQKTFLLKSIVYIVPFVFYMPYYYGVHRISFLMSELFMYLFFINFFMYAYHYYINRSTVTKTKDVVIYGAGRAGIKLEEEFKNTIYKTQSFCDDDKIIQNRSLDNIKIISPEKLEEKLQDTKYDLLVIAMPSASEKQKQKIYNRFHPYFDEIKLLPSLENILDGREFKAQLKDISVEDLLARHPQDLDKTAIKKFIKDKVVLVTGAGGSIGSEIVRQCNFFEAKQIIAIDHSEFNLYSIEQEVPTIIPVMQSVVNIEDLKDTFMLYKPQIVIHAAAYKHVPLVEANIKEAIVNNIVGTKNIIDIASKYNVENLVLISTDKAVRPTNVMGTTKRICELYAQNKHTSSTVISAVRFGNVLGSSGSIIPKFKQLINDGKNLTVTHPDITRYFMLIPEACELVLQAGALGKGGEIFILDMGKEVKIVDLAKQMIELSGRKDINIEFTGLRAGEKLYEELLIDGTQATTKYESITVAKPTFYDITRLEEDIQELLVCKDKLKQLKKIVPEFHHNK